MLHYSFHLALLYIKFHGKQPNISAVDPWIQVDAGCLLIMNIAFIEWNRIDGYLRSPVVSQPAMVRSSIVMASSWRRGWSRATALAHGRRLAHPPIPLAG